MKRSFGLIAGLTAVLISTSSSYAGREAGNGGNGIKIGSKIYLLDLVEAGVEQSPYFDASSKADPSDVQVIKESLSFIDDATADLFARKINELRTLDPLSAWVVMLGVNSYEWSLVGPALIPVGDEETNLDLDSSQVVQLAIRAGRRILIHHDNWNQITEDQRAALILHEIMYALLKPHDLIQTDPVSGQTIKYSKQSSPEAREIVGYLFSPASANRKRGGFLKVASNRIPTLDSSQFLRTLPSNEGFDVGFGDLNHYWNIHFRLTHEGKAIIPVRAVPFSESRELDGEAHSIASSICEFVTTTPAEISLTSIISPYAMSMKYPYAIRKNNLRFASFKDVAENDREYIRMRLFEDGDYINVDHSLDSTFTLDSIDQCVPMIETKIKAMKDKFKQGFELFPAE